MTQCLLSTYYVLALFWILESQGKLAYVSFLPAPVSNLVRRVSCALGLTSLLCLL